MVQPISKLEFWVQQVLPQVYDDSLSFYELLNKVVAKLNEVIDTANVYFAEDISSHVGTILEGWMLDGTLATIINEEIFATKVSSEDIKAIREEANSFQYTLDNINWKNVSTEFWATPEQYGAKGDGVTDDTAALQELFDNHTNIFLPNKFYKASNVKIRNSIRIESNGAVILPSSNVPVFQTELPPEWIEIEPIILKGFIVEGSGGSENCGIEIKHGKNILIENVKFMLMPKTGLHLDYCSHFEIKSCQFEAIGTAQEVNENLVKMGSACVIQNSSYGTVHHNKFYDIWQIAVFVWADYEECVGVGVHHNTIEYVQDNAIRFQPDPHPITTIRDWNAVRGCHASYNTIKNVTIDGIRLSGNSNHAIGNVIQDVDGRAITMQGGNDLMISKNTVFDCSEGIRLFCDIAHCLRGAVEGNELHNIYGAARAIGVLGNTNPVTAGVLTRECSVVNNRVHDSGGYGIEIANASGCTVANNIVKSSSKAGIYLRDANRILISGNQTKNNNTSDGPYAGIQTDVNTTQCIITGNASWDDTSPQKQTQGVYLAAGGSFIVVKDNSVYSNKNPQGVYDLSGNPTSNKISDNLI